MANVLRALHTIPELVTNGTLPKPSSPMPPWPCSTSALVLRNRPRNLKCVTANIKKRKEYKKINFEKKKLIKKLNIKKSCFASHCNLPTKLHISLSWYFNSDCAAALQAHFNVLANIFSAA